MRLLIIGAGGREHALALKLAESQRVQEVLVTPGNGGTAAGHLKIRNVEAHGDYLRVALEQNVDLTIVGPEDPLANGIVDTFQEQGLRIWGPGGAAAQIEASKAYAKSFMQRHNIPTAAYASFTDYDAARAYLLAQTSPVVIKGSGLAAGKAVILPETLEEGEQALQDLMLEHKFGAAGDEVVIEERLTGAEVSVLAFCDGKTALMMPGAQDHKRALEGDRGLNTGGMGAYAPAPIFTPELQEEALERILKPTLGGLRAEGCPFVGILYAGLMLTEAGLKVLEFNCRFGDPETQVLLPLLETDLLKIIEASLEGQLEELDVRWRSGTAATVVLASGGYPEAYEKGKAIKGLVEAAALESVSVYHAGTSLQEATVVTSGGRVLNVTGVGETLREALERAYEGVSRIRFEGMHYRRDIGYKAVGAAIGETTLQGDS